jgi:hypothetical protein
LRAASTATNRLAKSRIAGITEFIGEYLCVDLQLSLAVDRL